MSTATRRLFEEVSTEHPPEVPAAIALARPAETVRPLAPLPRSEAAPIR